MNIPILIGIVGVGIAELVAVFKGKKRAAFIILLFLLMLVILNFTL